MHLIFVATMDMRRSCWVAVLAANREKFAIASALPPFPHSGLGIFHIPETGTLNQDVYDVFAFITCSIESWMEHGGYTVRLRLWASR